MVERCVLQALEVSEDVCAGTKQTLMCDYRDDEEEMYVKMFCFLQLCLVFLKSLSLNQLGINVTV